MQKNELVKKTLELDFIFPAFTDKFVEYVLDMYMDAAEYKADHEPEFLLGPGDFEDMEREGMADGDSFIDIITSLEMYGDIIENIPPDEDMSDFFEACAGNFGPYMKDVYRVFNYYKMSYEMGMIIHSPVREVW